MGSPCNMEQYRVCNPSASCSPREGDEEIKEKLCPEPKSEPSEAAAGPSESVSLEAGAEGARFIANTIANAFSSVLRGLGQG